MPKKLPHSRNPVLPWAGELEGRGADWVKLPGNELAYKLLIYLLPTSGKLLEEQGLL